MSPLDEHLAWVFQHGGWANAQNAQRSAVQKDFSEAPIKRWLEERNNARRSRLEHTAPRAPRL